ncbi:DUF4307 domain-containing protein [Aeromicrobium sp. YIM 150415]|uniref:DUF4307 domain-containing protein n=1 Tax=Aeromicrobium sp. YIM 150415 TaxID=2803912 RepID=UPI0019647C3E|nr:DUF4307 domain-containing protein [Aeromicrobium sp. YIM 150415]MBM9465096.1 DUF4307 domain-containing protein [Aeromicrobium sp. YIM 150415]
MTDLTERYGRKRTVPRWVLPLVAVVGISLGVAWAAWTAWDDVPPYQSEVFGYEVQGEDLTTITINVYRSEDVALECEVYAQAESKAIVGETVVEVPASPRNTRVTAEIITEHRATTAVIRTCEPA